MRFLLALANSRQCFQGPTRSPFLPGGRFEARSFPLKTLILNAFETTAGMVKGWPKFVDDAYYDILAKAPAQTTSVAGGNGMTGEPPVDYDALDLMVRALLIDRFKLKTHYEDQLMDAHVLVAAKPKMKKADPANRTGCREGPGPDGKTKSIFASILRSRFIVIVVLPAYASAVRGLSW